MELSTKHLSASHASWVVTCVTGVASSVCGGSRAGHDRGAQLQAGRQPSADAAAHRLQHSGCGRLAHATQDA